MQTFVDAGIRGAPSDRAATGVSSATIVVYVSPNRLLKIINLVLALLLIATLGATYWYVYRPLPQVRGEMEAPIAAGAEIARDSLGVPHIRAGSIEDALFLQGFVTAQDRLWQMDLLRRVGAGELSEVFGRAALDLDRDYARLGMRRIARDHTQNMTDSDRAIFAAYARGVNYFLETHRNNLPVEFTLLGYHPRPWRIEDSIGVGLHMFRILSATWRDELLKRSMLATGDAKKVNALFPVRTGNEVHPGSNAWALAGSRTQSGKPILANDPHLEWSHPSTWYLAHLQAPGLNVAGATVPGLPAVLVGHNQRIAWGMTVLQFDVQDLYIERLDERTGRYEFQGQVEQARPDQQMIAIKGEPAEAVLTWVTRHGPVIISEAGDVMALRWTAAERGGFDYPFLAINQAAHWEEFNAALARYPGPGMNFVYADVEGNIGYHAAGKFPIRRNFDGDVPVIGSTGQFEWDNYIPYEQLPGAFNPPSGLVITANQNPFPDNYSYRVNGKFDTHFRSRQIEARLLAKPKWDVEGQLAIQTDLYSGFSRYLARQAVAAWDRSKLRNETLAEPVQLLRDWNGQMLAEGSAPFIATLLYQHVRRGLVERAAPGKALAYDYPMGPAVVERVVRDRSAEWFTDYDKLLMVSLAEAVEEGQRLQGRDPRRWEYGRYMNLRLSHPVLGRVPYVGRYFTLGPVPMSGSTTTVKQTSLRLGPSMRMVAAAGDWDASLQNITIGQSGQPLSWHFKDQWNHYLAGRSYRMQFGSVEPRSVLHFRPAK